MKQIVELSVKNAKSFDMDARTDGFPISIVTI